MAGSKMKQSSPDSLQHHLLLSGVTSSSSPAQNNKHTSEWEDETTYFDADDHEQFDRDGFVSIEKANQHQKKNTLVSSIVAFVCTTVGAGTLALPSSIGESGWLGLFIIVIVAAACNQTAQYLIACMFSDVRDAEGNRLRIHTFEDIGTAAYGKRGRYVVALLQTVTLYGACAIFLILIGGNMSTLTGVNEHIWVIIAAAILIPVSWLKTMKEISYLAYFGLLASLTVGVVVIVEGLRRISNPDDAVNNKGAPVSIEHELIRWAGISPAINVIVFSFGGHSVIPAIVHEMKNPQKVYKKFAALSFGSIGFVYAAVASCGYAGYGIQTAVDGNILNTMTESTGPGHSVVAIQIARGFITAHVALAYPLPLNPVCLLVEELTGIDKLEGRKELTYRIAMRSSLVIGSAVIALAMPYFADILQLVSALSIISIAFVLPPIFYWKLYHTQMKISLGHRIFMMCSVVGGLAASGIGMYYAVNSLINDIKLNSNPFANFFG